MLSALHKHSFRSAGQFASYLGLVLVERQSGPAYIRAKFYMAAMAAIWHNRNLKALYQRLQANGKSKMPALGTIMRKLAHLCLGVLKTQMPYQPDYSSLC